MRKIRQARTPTAERFDPDFDYRMIRNTKPHEVHLNQVFEHDGAVWGTRLIPQDAVCLDDRERRVRISVGQPHDGRPQVEGPYAGDLFFTTTNGWIVHADGKTLEVVNTIDLAQLSEGDEPLGWCRGIEVVGERAFVGFTRIRETAHARYKFWKGGATERARPSRVVEVDLARREIVSTRVIEHAGATIYSLLRFDP